VTHKILFSFFPGSCPKFLCYLSKKIVQIKKVELFLEKLLKDVLPEHKNIPESRRVW